MRDYLLPIRITFFIVNALVMYSIRPYGYNLTAMIRMSETEAEGVAPEYFQKGMVVMDGGGYDGQFYYYVAMDPFLTKGHFKNAYRQQRILYPLLARTLAGGRDSLIPYAMYLVNLIALAVGVALIVRILKGYSLSPYLSLFYGLAPPSIMTIQYNLPSPVSLSLIIAAFYSYLKDRLYLTAVLFALAFLTREDTIVAFVPLMLWDLQRERSPMRLLVLLSSLAPFFAWQLFVMAKLGTLPTDASSSVLNPIPFSGILGYFTLVVYDGVVQTLKAMSSGIVLLYFLTVGVFILRALFKRRHLFYYVVAAYALLVFFTVESQWNNFNGLIRMFYNLFPFLLLSYAVERDVYIKYAVFFIGFLTFLTAVRIIFVSPVYPFKIW